MDEWSILDEVDVVGAKWPAEHKKAVLEPGAKWKERKEGLEALNTQIEQNPRLSTASLTIYGELMDELRKILDRESNIVVVTTAIRTVELLARGLRSKFQAFIGMVVPFLIKRAKDKKKNVRDAILAAMAAVADTTTPERLQKDVIEWFSIPSPESKQTLLAFLSSFWCRQYQLQDMPFVKSVAPLIVKTTSESDVTVRDKACQALGSLKRLMGDAISVFLVPISTEQPKLDKIQQYVEEAQEEFKKFEESQPKPVSAENGCSTDLNAPSEGNGASAENQNSATSSVMDPWDIADAEDVAKKIDKGVEAQLVDKNWKERVAGGENVKKSMDGVIRIELSERLLEILKKLIKIIEKDVNVNVAALAAQILTETAKKSRFAFAQMAHRAFPVVFDKLKDRKAVLRDALVEFCDEAAVTTPLSAYTDAVISALGSKNPQTRQQTALFLARFYAKNDQKTVEIDVLKQLAEHVLKTTNDADKEVREAALRTVAAIQKSMGEAVAKRLLMDVYEDKMKAEKIPTIVDELQKEYGSSAHPEMLRLAKHYKLGSGSAPSSKGAPPPARSSAPSSASSSSSAPRGAPRSSAPSGPSRPTSSAAAFKARPAPTAPAPRAPTKATVLPSGTVGTANVTQKRPVSAARRAPSPKAPPTLPTATKPKPFVARPAPNFGAPAKPVGSTVAGRAGGIGRAPGTTTTSTSRPTSSGVGARKVQPIQPNVVRHQGAPARPGSGIGAMGRPQAGSGASGASGAATSSRSRIAAPSSGLPTSSLSRPGSSGLPGGSSSRIARPPTSRPGSRPASRPSSRNE